MPNVSEIKRSNPDDGMHFFFQFALNKSGIFHEISDVLDYFIVCYLPT